MGSKLLAKTPLPPTLLALLAGVLLGPAVLGWVDFTAVSERTQFLERAARLTLGIGLVSVALRIPKEYPLRHWRELAVLISLGMVLMWGVSTALVYLCLGLPFWMAVLIGAIVTPTDPIAATPIVTRGAAEKLVPERLRQLLSFESVLMTDSPTCSFSYPSFSHNRSPGEALQHWLMHTLLWEIGAATLFGGVLGMSRLAGRRGRRTAGPDTGRLAARLRSRDGIVGGRRGAVDQERRGAARVCGRHDVSQYVSGIDRKTEEHGQEAVNCFFSIPIFALLGIRAAMARLGQMGWTGPYPRLLVLLLRRPPVLLLLRPRCRAYAALPRRCTSDG